MRHSSARNKQVYGITAFDERDKKGNDHTLFWLGLILIVVSLISLKTGLEERAKHNRWQLAAQLYERGELQTIGQGNDLTLSGSISPETPASDEGLALYEAWERKRSGKRKKWKLVGDSKPDWELLFGPHSVVIQSEHADFQRATEIKLDSNTRLKGFAPGDEVSVMGTVASTDGARVQADVLCGGDREQCLGQMSKEATKDLLQAAAMVLVGVGFTAFDLIARKKSQ